jgi:hypothetical protein
VGYLLYACYKQQRQQLAGIDYVFSGLEFVPFSKRADSRYMMAKPGLTMDA